MFAEEFSSRLRGRCGLTSHLRDRLLHTLHLIRREGSQPWNMCTCVHKSASHNRSIPQKTHSYSFATVSVFASLGEQLKEEEGDTEGDHPAFRAFGVMVVASEGAIKLLWVEDGSSFGRVEVGCSCAVTLECGGAT